MIKKGKPVFLKRDQVFISYSRRDIEYFNTFKTIISPYLRSEILDVWYDKKIKPGENWRKEIDKALAKARVAVLLVSSNFLFSDFIMKEELPYFIHAAKNEKVKNRMGFN